MQATTNATNLTTNGANFAASLNYQQQQQQQQAMLNQIHLNQMNLLQTQQQHQQQQQQQQQQLQQQQHKDTTFTKIFVGGLPYHTTDESLRQFFQKFGNIEEAVVITDRTTGKSRGYGFVTMETKEAAEAAVYEPNPIIDGRKANVNLAYLGVKSRIVQPTSYIPVSIGRYPMPTSSTPTYGFPQLIYQPVASTPAQFQIATGAPTNFLLSSQQLPAFTSAAAAPPPNNTTANGSQTIPGIFDLSTTIAVNSAAYNSVAAAAAAAALNNNPNRTSPFVNEQAPGASHLATQFIPFGNAGAAANPAASNNSQANSNTPASYFTLPNNHHHLANFN